MGQCRCTVVSFGSWTRKGRLDPQRSQLKTYVGIQNPRLYTADWSPWRGSFDKFLVNTAYLYQPAGDRGARVSKRDYRQKARWYNASLEARRDAVVPLPDNFNTFVDNLLRESEKVEGHLSPREMRFLALLAACPTAKGEILEIGSFKGKSTVILARAASLAGNARVVAVDPLTSPSVTDPDLRGEESCLKEFQSNLQRARVSDAVEFHQTFSFELAKEWNRPIRLLWIDGDHTYAGTKIDFDLFSPFLSAGAIVAVHDVLHEYEGSLRVFMEDILLSPRFGAVGLCGSIGWSQFVSDPALSEVHRRRKIRLYKRLSPLVPYVVFGRKLSPWEKKTYKFHRWRVPHGEVDPAAWIKEVGLLQ